jgi:hypothetical protein
MCEDPFADEASDLAEKDSGGDHDGRGTTSGRLRSLRIGQSAALVGAESRAPAKRFYIG